MKNRIFSVCVVFVLSCACMHSGNALESGFHDFPTTVQGEERAGAIHIPEGYDADKAYPLIVFLHGSGERGDDGEAQTTSGLGNAIRENPERFPCIVYMPQCPKSVKWSGEREGQEAMRSPHDFIQVGIATIKERFSIDEDRVYLTGLSMGGRGTYTYGSKHLDEFAAFLVVCARGSKREAIALANKPLWIFHGEADDVIPIKAAEYTVNAIQKTGKKVKFTRYPGVGHNSWDRAYGKEQGAIEWLLEQRR